MQAFRLMQNIVSTVHTAAVGFFFFYGYVDTAFFVVVVIMDSCHCETCKEPLRGLTTARLEPRQSDDHESHSLRQYEDGDGYYNDMSDAAILDWIEREGAFPMFCCGSVTS